ncbi:Shikimate dehydrogenase (NADP(+)) [Porphyromonas levii]|uniref:shikimate dehydrogenase family protein n=1 Tax=Porphyromonas levii TaxID=28114 RepID=UPI0003667D6C|nr:hypothetical protein [Porphyromonas levii]MBR8760507.1 Shikimate dehydrogenase (NADP(+)) [Porphyromonas levii]MBR8785642.1 Shikimate dehydrogenase (NADP(+)) [Porphyromonas levii]
MTRKYGLIGKGISYSRSPEIWQELWQKEGVGDCSFEIIDTDNPQSIIQQFRLDPSWYGLMVTTPYKETVLPLLDTLSIEAQEVGAVNAIAKSNGSLIGYNTDIAGFLAPLEGYLLEGNALVLGSGGASKAVRYALKSIGMNVAIVSRSPREGELSYNEVTTSYLASTRIIVNATPLGGPLFPDRCPDIPYSALTDKHILYDLSYLPPLRFLSVAPATCIKINGEDMLRAQAGVANGIFQRLGK